jgi:hypothetical protein
MSRGRGVFRRLVHEIDNGALTVDFNGIPLWFARCGASCALLPGHRERGPYVRRVFPRDRRGR